MVRLIEKGVQYDVVVDENKFNLYIGWECIIFENEKLKRKYGDEISDALMKIMG